MSSGQKTGAGKKPGAVKNANAGKKPGAVKNADAGPKAANWPQTADGVADWESVFEHSKTGLVSLVRQAGSEHALKACATVIIKSLFTRQGDENISRHYFEILEGIVPKKGDKKKFDIHALQSETIDLLRLIKNDRVQRAEAYLQNKKAKETEKEKGKERRNIHETEGDFSSKDLFSLVFIEIFKKRFSTMHQGVVQDGQLPFVLSKRFSDYFMDIIREHFIPELLPRCRAMFEAIEALPIKERRAVMDKTMLSREGRERVWVVWCGVWKLLTEQQEIPEEPKSKTEQKGLFSVFKKKKEKHGWEIEELTHEEWLEEKARIEKSNVLAENIWSALRAENENYLPPLDGDRKLLMDLYARSPDGLRKHMDILLQYARENKNVAKSFDDYQAGKDIDLSLLSLCYRLPDLFLHEQKILKKMSGGFDKTRRRMRLPLTSRYLSEFM